MPAASGGLEYLLVAINKKTGRVEAYPAAQVNSAQVVLAIKDIARRFGTISAIITDLGSTLPGGEFWDLCEGKGIDVRYMSAAHPRASGQATRADGMILSGLQARIQEHLRRSNP